MLLFFKNKIRRKKKEKKKKRKKRKERERERERERGGEGRKKKKERKAEGITTLVDFELAASVIQQLKASRFARVPSIDKGVRKGWTEGKERERKKERKEKERKADSRGFRTRRFCNSAAKSFPFACAIDR